MGIYVDVNVSPFFYYVLSSFEIKEFSSIFVNTTTVKELFLLFYIFNNYKNIILYCDIPPYFQPNYFRKKNALKDHKFFSIPKLFFGNDKQTDM